MSCQLSEEFSFLIIPCNIRHTSDNKFTLLVSLEAARYPKFVAITNWSQALSQIRAPYEENARNLSWCPCYCPPQYLKLWTLPLSAFVMQVRTPHDEVILQLVCILL